MHRLATSIKVLLTSMLLVISMLVFCTTIWNQVILDNDNKIKAQPLLTLFTTAIDKDWKRIAYNNTFRNWALLRPHVTPVFYFGSNDTLHQNAL